jgi:hypothetical protein
VLFGSSGWVCGTTSTTVATLLQPCPPSSSLLSRHDGVDAWTHPTLLSPREMIGISSLFLYLPPFAPPSWPAIHFMVRSRHGKSRLRWWRENGRTGLERDSHDGVSGFRGTAARERERENRLGRRLIRMIPTFLITCCRCANGRYSTRRTTSTTKLQTCFVRGHFDCFSLLVRSNTDGANKINVDNTFCGRSVCENLS